MSHRILVVGAGPVGLTAALELKRAGYDVDIIDKNSEITPLSRAIGINARSMELFEASGFTDQLLAAGRKIRQANLWLEDKQAVKIDYKNLQHKYNFILALPQHETERMIETALNAAGVVVQRETELLDLQQDNQRVIVATKNSQGEEKFRYDYLVGADGAHSIVRKSVGLAFTGKQYPEEWGLADVDMSWGYGDTEANAFIHNNGLVLVAIPISDSRFRLISNANHIFSLLPKEAKVDNIHWQSQFTIHCRIVKRYQRGRVFLMGDAAHVHSPAGGRGMNLGIEDAFSFVHLLKTHRLSHYTDERRHVGQVVLKETDMAFRGLKQTNWFLRAIRNHIIFPLMNRPKMQNKLLWSMSGLPLESRPTGGKNTTKWS